jgi:biopolymer transport protein ExbD
MVDVVFVLMLFFMVSASFQQKELLLGAQLAPPYVGGAPTPIEVSVDANGEVYLQNRLIAGAEDHKVAALSSWLTNAKAQFGGSDPVVIAPAPTVPHDRVMQVLNAVNAAHWDHVSFR